MSMINPSLAECWNEKETQTHQLGDARYCRCVCHLCPVRAESGAGDLFRQLCIRGEAVARMLRRLHHCYVCLICGIVLCEKK